VGFIDFGIVGRIPLELKLADAEDADAEGAH